MKVIVRTSLRTRAWPIVRQVLLFLKTRQNVELVGTGFVGNEIICSVIGDEMVRVDSILL